MSDEIQEYITRLRRRDPSFKIIGVYNTDADVAELADCLLAHPDLVTEVYLEWNQLTDKVGVKLARYVAVSSTVRSLSLRYSQLSFVTYLAMAAALRVNTSLRGLYLSGNQAMDTNRVEAEFVDALRLNPNRPADSTWWLYSSFDDCARLQVDAKQQGHPTLQMILNNQLEL